MLGVLIDDGFTAAKTIEARPGFHGAAEAVYRPALQKVRHEYAAVMKSSVPDRMEAFDCDLVAKYLVTLNGKPVERRDVPRIHPLVRNDLVDLILSFAPGAVPPEDALGNSSGASAS